MDRLIVLYFENRISPAEREELEEALKQEDVRVLFKAYATTYALINSNTTERKPFLLRASKRKKAAMLLLLYLFCPC